MAHHACVGITGWVSRGVPHAGTLKTCSLHLPALHRKHNYSQLLVLCMHAKCSGPSPAQPSHSNDKCLTVTVTNYIPTQPSPNPAQPSLNQAPTNLAPTNPTQPNPTQPNHPNDNYLLVTITNYLTNCPKCSDNQVTNTC